MDHFMKQVTPAKFPPPPPPNQGTKNRNNKLISKKEAITIYKNSCIEYVNEQIKKGCKNKQISIELQREYLYDELLEEIKREYNIAFETEKYICLSLNKENFKYDELGNITKIIEE
ncbi:hypothetical protein FDC49_19085 [Clostridium sporogenes]|uniref:hypothetical protein n=1 Tax=Clostridium sporogenes TaxID=1509 RepID=UPI0013D4FEFF|nr:hypothetical protein [Clostridium sporogenes]NFH34432.1 hypothetical protein [Clostridium sporogenes]NFL21799.1 hypothetical protein [Clostridium sporogenes]NFN74066.1 hypothetical protein [Clostridium sporogenes]NFV23486.1 hypothetical protein [Clostridium sporogenes]